MTGWTMLLFGGMWKTLDFGLEKLLNTKWDLMGHPRRSMEDNHAKGNVDYGGLASKRIQKERILETTLVIFWLQM